MRGQQCNHYESALNEWKVHSGSVDLPQNPIFQSEWDKPLYETRFDLLLHSVTSLLRPYYTAKQTRNLLISNIHLLSPQKWSQFVHFNIEKVFPRRQP